MHMSRVILDVPYTRAEIRLHRMLHQGGRMDSKRKCRGCGQPIESGQVVYVTVQAANHVISVPAHDEHREAARANALEDKSWQGRGDTSHYAG
jgi:hypothetical protein